MTFGYSMERDRNKCTVGGEREEVSVCVCLCERKRGSQCVHVCVEERERERGSECVHVCACV